MRALRGYQDSGANRDQPSFVRPVRQPYLRVNRPVAHFDGSSLLITTHIQMIEIVQFIGLVGTVSNIGKTLFQAHTQAERDRLQIEFSDAMIALQFKISEMQVSYQSILDSNVALKKQLEAYDTWEAERARYSLFQPSAGAFVYRLNPSSAANDPAHWLCAACYNERKKSILQRESEDSAAYICSRDPNHQIFIGEGLGTYM